MSIWLRSRKQLTAEQEKAVMLSHTRHQVIVGMPGSEKTQVLLHRTQELRQRLGVSADRFRIIVYTNVLKEYIRSALPLLDLPEETVETFDEWCSNFYRQHILEPLSFNCEPLEPDFETIREGVANWVEHEDFREPLLDFVLIEGGEDLPPVAYSIFRRVSRHVTVCINYQQFIYRHSAPMMPVLQALGLRRRNVTWLHASQYPQGVVALAAWCIEDATERRKYLARVKGEITEYQTPMLYLAPTYEDEKHHLAEVLRQRLLLDSRIGIFISNRSQVSILARYLRDQGLEVETQENMDFSSRRPKVMTFHSAKGLTFDSVFLPQLGASVFTYRTESEIYRLLFMGITCATRWVYLSAVQTDALPLVQKMQLFVPEERLFVKKGPSGAQCVGKSVEREEDVLDFLL